MVICVLGDERGERGPDVFEDVDERAACNPAVERAAHASVERARGAEGAKEVIARVAELLYRRGRDGRDQRLRGAANATRCRVPACVKKPTSRRRYPESKRSAFIASPASRSSSLRCGRCGAAADRRPSRRSRRRRCGSRARSRRADRSRGSRGCSWIRRGGAPRRLALSVTVSPARQPRVHRGQSIAIAAFDERLELPRTRRCSSRRRLRGAIDRRETPAR